LPSTFDQDSVVSFLTKLYKGELLPGLAEGQRHLEHALHNRDASICRRW